MNIAFCPTGLIFSVRETDRMIVVEYIFCLKASCFCLLLETFVDRYVKAMTLLALKTSSLLIEQFLFVALRLFFFNPNAPNDACLKLYSTSQNK